jgi:hypothetical protein
MTRLPLIAIFAALIAALIGCDSPMNNRVVSPEVTKQKTQLLKLQVYPYSIETQWLVGPFGNLDQNNQLLVFLRDSSGQPVNLPESLTIDFYSTMPSMGHPLDDAGYFERISDGIYLNQHIKFNMPGDWKHELWLLDENFNIKDKIQWSEFF